jgi:hypothetical protein
MSTLLNIVELCGTLSSSEKAGGLVLAAFRV